MIPKETETSKTYLEIVDEVKLEIPTLDYTPQEDGVYLIKNQYGVQELYIYSKENDYRASICLPPSIVLELSLKEKEKDFKDYLMKSEQVLSDSIVYTEEAIVSKIQEMLIEYEKTVAEVKDAIDIAVNQYKTIREGNTTSISELSQAVCDIIKAYK